MNSNYNIYPSNIDKASALRETNIFEHKNFNTGKIRLIINYKDKFPVKSTNEKPYNKILQ